MRQWFLSLFQALIPALDHDRREWRAEMCRQYEASQRQNEIESVYLSTQRGTKPSD